MSLERIESAYATCLGDKRITGTQMATLLCLCWHANPKTGACFPSTETISQMTHFGTTAIEEARRRLRELGLIDWITGGRDTEGHLTNRYSFLFPLLRMRDVVKARYETSIEQSQPVDNSVKAGCRPPARRGTLPRRAGTPTPSGGVEYPVSRGQNIKENKTEAKAMVAESAPISSVDISDLAKSVNLSARRRPVEFHQMPAIEDPFAHASRPLSLVDKAMMACGVKDMDNRRCFNRIMMTRDADACRKVVEQFQDEVWEGRHKTLDNRAAYLVTLLQRLPCL